jgi:hypothetical protein
MAAACGKLQPLLREIPGTDPLSKIEGLVLWGPSFVPAALERPHPLVSHRQPSNLRWVKTDSTAA